jgi:CheY-like chemotaxis protein
LEFAVFFEIRDWDLEIVRNSEQKIKSKDIVDIVGIIGEDIMRKILIVDDERSICKLLQHVFEGSEYIAEIAHTGSEAIKKLQKFQPDLVMLDVHMPEINGWQVLEGIRLSPRTCGISVIMLTEKNMIGDIEKADKLGVQGYITKPFTVERVLKKVNEVLGV